MKIFKAKVKEHIYRGNKIIEYSDGTFIAYYYAKDDNSEDIMQFPTDNLVAAQRRIDEYARSTEELCWDEEDKK